MRPITTPSLDPLAHRAAIDALDAQRAAYRRYARTVEAQQRTLAGGDADRATAVAEAAAQGFAELEDGARRLPPLVARVRADGSADQMREMQGQMDELMREARQAEAAIRNLSAQLEAWRDAYGRQLAELGLAPGGGPAESGAPEAVAGAGHRVGYGPPGFGARTQSRGGPSLIDRTG